MRVRRRVGEAMAVVAVSVAAGFLPSTTAFADTDPNPPVVVEEDGGAEVVEAPQTAPDEKPALGVEYCDAGQYTKNRVSTFVRTPTKSWLVDGRGNPHPTVLRKSTGTTRTQTSTWTASAGVSTSVQAGLKFLAEGKIDVTLGVEYSAQKSVTISGTEEWTLTFPANQKSRWTVGWAGARVTADVYSISRNCRTTYVGKATAYWPAQEEHLWWAKA